MTTFEPVIIDIETTGLNPMAEEWHDNQDYDAQVYSVAFGFIPNWREARSVDELEIEKRHVKGDDEYGLLGRLSGRINNFVTQYYGGDIKPFWVGHNIRKYDFPYLGARFARKRLDGWPFTHGWKRLDTFKVAMHDDSIPQRFISEDDYAASVGLSNDDPFDGSDMPEAFENRNWQKIATHVMGDVELNSKLFYKKRAECMTHFQRHYDGVNVQTNFTEEVQL